MTKLIAGQGLIVFGVLDLLKTILIKWKKIKDEYAFEFANLYIKLNIKYVENNVFCNFRYYF